MRWVGLGWVRSSDSSGGFRRDPDEGTHLDLDLDMGSEAAASGTVRSGIAPLGPMGFVPELGI